VLHSEVVGSMVCPEGTAALLRPKLEEVLTRVKLNLKDAYVTTDAGQPMPALFSDMLGRWFRCFAHLSQNAVEAALKKNDDFGRLLALADTLVGQVVCSNKRLAVFKTVQATVEAGGTFDSCLCFLLTVTVVLISLALCRPSSCWCSGKFVSCPLGLNGSKDCVCRQELPHLSRS
jgi:hypothetical protein